MSGRRRQGTSSRSASSSGRHQNRPVALVTGATSGIGLAVTRDLARDHDLILLARTPADLDELAAALSEDSPARVRTRAVDLTDDAAVTQAVKSLRLKTLDLVVHSAGVEAPGTVAELPASRWRRVLDLDLVAVAHLTSLLLPALREQRGLVVMINSGAGLRASSGQALYCAAKAGLKALADALRAEEQGTIRVTTVYPGRVDTPMQVRLHRDAARRRRRSGGAPKAYRAADHMTPASVAATVRTAVDIPPDACVEDLSVRPANML